MYIEACRDQMVQGPPDPRPVVTTQKWKSNSEGTPNCPRCASPNTKFCYYNNYSLSQPRYFCKACRRYWTKGGSLRNVPVGGGCRKRLRRNPGRKTQPPSSSSTIPPTTTTTSSMVPPPSTRRSDGDGDDDGSVIDLAAVFHHFLNQSSVSGNTGTEVLVGSELAEDSNALLEFSSSVSLTTQGGDHHELLSAVPDHRDRKEEQMQIQEYCMGHDPESFGLQNMLSTDEPLGHDFLWSDELVGMTFQWDDQSKDSDNWSLFDDL